MCALRNTLVLAALLVPASLTLGGDSAAQNRARRFMERENVRKLVLLFAHPEAEFRKQTCVSQPRVVDAAGRELPGASGLLYDFHWRSPISGDMNTTRMTFILHKGGRVEVQPGKTTSFFPPLSATDAVLNYARNEIRRDPNLGRNVPYMAPGENG
jgi:hypothetical protein